MEKDRKFRYVSTKDCEEIGRGSHGIIYRLNEEQILKVYTDNSTFSVIDLAELSCGHGIFDLGSLYMTLVFSGKLSGKLVKNITGLNKEQALLVWKILLRRYLGTENEKELLDFEKKCVIIRNLRLANLISTTNTFPQVAYRVDGRWAKEFLIKKEDRCRKLLSEL